MLPRVGIVAVGSDAPGGQGVQARALATELRREGYAVRFLPIDPRFPRGLRWARRIRYWRTLVNQMLYVPSLLRLRHVGVVHVFAASYWSFLIAPLPAILAGRILGRRTVLVYHSGEAEDHLSRWGRLVHPWLRLADEIVVPSTYLQGVFARHGYGTRVIRNVVDTSRFAYRERRPLEPRLLSTRNLEAHYGVDNTLRAFAMIEARHPRASLTVAGYGSQELRLRALASQLGIRNARFVGRVEPDDMPRLYDAADVFVNSSHVDNQPVSLLEAFASGLSVVTTGPGDVPAMTGHGKLGLLVPPNDPAAMAGAVEELLQHPELARRRASEARREVERYTWESVRKDWAAVSGAPA